LRRRVPRCRQGMAAAVIGPVSTEFAPPKEAIGAPSAVAVDLQLEQLENVPSGSVVSVRLGQRSQQFVATEGQVYSFSVAAFDDAPAAKFSVYAPLAHARLLMQPGEARFSLPLEAQEGPGVQVADMSVDFEVVSDKDANLSLASSRNTQEDDAGMWAHLVPNAMVPYFREHRLVSMLTGLLQGVIREQPDDLRGFMVKVLHNSFKARQARQRAGTEATLGAAAGGKHALRLMGSKGIPSGSILSVRVGRTRKQALIKVGHLFKFDELDALDHMKVSVLGMVAQRKMFLSKDEKQIAVQLEPQKGGEDYRMSLTMGLCFQTEASNDVPVSAAAKNARHKKALDVEPYLQKHRLFELLQELLQALMREKPAEPLKLMMLVLNPDLILDEARPMRNLPSVGTWLIPLSWKDEEVPAVAPKEQSVSAAAAPPAKVPASAAKEQGAVVTAPISEAVAAPTKGPPASAPKEQGAVVTAPVPLASAQGSDAAEIQYSPSVCTWFSSRLPRLRGPRVCSSKADIWEVQHEAPPSTKAALPLFLPSVGSWATPRLSPLLPLARQAAAPQQIAPKVQSRPFGRLPSVGTWLASVPCPEEVVDAAAAAPVIVDTAHVVADVPQVQSRPFGRLPSVGTWLASVPCPEEVVDAVATSPVSADTPQVQYSPSVCTWSGTRLQRLQPREASSKADRWEVQHELPPVSKAALPLLLPSVGSWAIARLPPVARRSEVATAADATPAVANTPTITVAKTCPQGVPAAICTPAQAKAAWRLPSVGTWIMAKPLQFDGESQETQEEKLEAMGYSVTHTYSMINVPDLNELPIDISGNGRAINGACGDETLTPTAFKIVEYRVEAPRSKSMTQGSETPSGSPRGSPRSRKVFRCTQEGLVARAQQVLTQSEEENFHEENELQHWMSESRHKLEKEMMTRLSSTEEDGDVIEEAMVLQQCDLEEQVCSRLAKLADSRREAAREARNLLNEVGTHSRGEVLARAQRLLLDAEKRSKEQEAALQKWLAGENDKLENEVVAQVKESHAKPVISEEVGLEDMPSDIERWMVAAQCDLEEQACSKLANMAEERREAVRRARGLLRLWSYDESRPGEHHRKSAESIPSPVGN